MSMLNVFDTRFRGFRVIEIGGVGVLLALILLVYLAKTIAGSESAEIDHVQQQISDERARVTLLRAEVASLEQPERLATLSGKYLGLQPVDAKHDIDAQALASIAGAPPPKPAAPAVAPDATPPAATPTPAPAPTAVAAVQAQPVAPQAAAVAPKAVVTKAVVAKAVATKPVAASPAPAKVVKVAAATPQKPAKPAKPDRTAAAEAGDTSQIAAAEPARRPSELKAPAGDPIGALVQASPDAEGAR